MRFGMETSPSSGDCLGQEPVSTWKMILGEQRYLMLFVGHNDVLKLLFKKGTEAGSEDHTRMALLLSAIKQNDEDVVKLLLETGKIDLEFKDGNGLTPLLCAVKGGSLGVVRVLLAGGAKTEDHSTRMALLLSAAEKNDEYVVKLLLETGKIDLEFKDGNGQTPLVRAKEGGSVAVVQLLLAEGVKTDYKDNIVSRFNISMISIRMMASTDNLDYCR